MRKLTLDEKIFIKGLLSLKGYCDLANLTMKNAMLFMYRAYGTSGYSIYKIRRSKSLLRNISHIGYK